MENVRNKMKYMDIIEMPLKIDTNGILTNNT